MKITEHNHKGIKFLCREGTSDYKTFEEVIVRNVYEKKYFKIQPGEHWMYVGNNMQVWRNSLYKNWGNEKFTVDCIHFSEVLKDPSHCVKMDIEGAEMDILEAMTLFPNKMVFEWSLDIDRSLTRYRNIIDKFKPQYKKLMYKEQFYGLPDESLPRNIPVACDNIYCYEKN